MVTCASAPYLSDGDRTRLERILDLDRLARSYRDEIARLDASHQNRRIALQSAALRAEQQIATLSAETPLPSSTERAADMDSYHDDGGDRRAQLGAS